jgi:hypothetical protein
MEETIEKLVNMLEDSIRKTERLEALNNTLKGDISYLKQKVRDLELDIANLKSKEA